MKPLFSTRWVLLILISAAVIAGADRLGEKFSRTDGVAYGTTFSLPVRGRNTYRLSYVGELATHCGHRDRHWLADLQTQWLAERMKRAVGAGYTREEAILIIDEAARSGASAAKTDYSAPGSEHICAIVLISADLVEADRAVTRWRNHDWSGLSIDMQ